MTISLLGANVLFYHDIDNNYQAEGAKKRAPSTKKPPLKWQGGFLISFGEGTIILIQNHRLQPSGQLDVVLIGSCKLLDELDGGHSGTFHRCLNVIFIFSRSSRFVHRQSCFKIVTLS
jgi:hypothetical protein